MMAHRTLVHGWRGVDMRWLQALVLALLAMLLPSAAAEAKPFPVDQFSYYLSDYDYDLGRLAKEVTKSETEILADIQAAETAGTPASQPPRSNSC